MPSKKHLKVDKPKVRLYQEECILTGTWYAVEVRGWFGWYKPRISYSDDNRFSDYDKAMKWVEYFASDQKTKRKLILER